MLTKIIIENLLLITGELFWMTAGLSQLLRLRKTRNIFGLSAPTVALDGSANVAWMTYFSLRHLPLPVVTNLANLLVNVSMLAYLLEDRKQFRRGVLAIAILGPLTSYVLFSFPHIAGWVGAFYNMIASTPWLLRVVWRRKVSGISERSLFLAWGAMLTTLTYGVLVDAPPLIFGCLQGMTYRAVIMRYYYRYRDHS